MSRQESKEGNVVKGNYDIVLPFSRQTIVFIISPEYESTLSLDKPIERKLEDAQTGYKLIKVKPSYKRVNNKPRQEYKNVNYQLQEYKPTTETYIEVESNPWKPSYNNNPIDDYIISKEEPKSVENEWRPSSYNKETMTYGSEEIDNPSNADPLFWGDTLKFDLNRLLNIYINQVSELSSSE